MTTPSNKKDPYSVLAQEAQQTEQTPAPTAAPNMNPQMTPTEKAEQSAAIPVQDTHAGLADGQSFMDIVIKVFIDIVARLTGQPSPTGGKIPTAGLSPQQLEKQLSASKEKIWGKVSDGLASVGNTIEHVADNTLQSAGTIVQKATKTVGSSIADTKNDVVNTAKDISQSAVNIAKDSISEVVDGAHSIIDETKDIIDTNIGHTDTPKQ